MDSDTAATASPDGVHVNVSVHVTGEVDQHPLEALRGLSNGMGVLEHNLRRTVVSARHGGCSWEQIGRALGMSRQSAWERFSKE